MGEREAAQTRATEEAIRQAVAKEKAKAKVTGGLELQRPTPRLEGPPQFLVEKSGD